MGLNFSQQLVTRYALEIVNIVDLVSLHTHTQFGGGCKLNVIERLCALPKTCYIVILLNVIFFKEPVREIDIK